jgi:hypothetical protein
VAAEAARPKHRRGRKRKPRPECERCHGLGVLPWHPVTLAWWRVIWRSPMAAEWLEADRHGLFRLAVLVDLFWREETVEVARKLEAEIRMQSTCFGLSPIDRRRLQWEMEDDAKKAEAADPDDEQPPTFNSKDVLRAIG